PLGPPTMAEVAEWVSQDLPRGLMPFANTGGGDLVCLDYRQGPTPSIAYWHHGRCGDEDEVTAVAASFTSFLELLHAPR
ncbi:MAG: SMI1/KNR4 family protein, partial [Deltaproteobacteria bacterium]|nr:SMI1/KNR4 family protein [Deltaproteobacteria bacterium]